jgi:hypothetical protein
MSNTSIPKTKIYGKTINAAIVDGAIILSFFVLLYLGMDFFHSLSIILLILYPLGISISTGMVIASIAETKHMARLKWGMLASATSLTLMVMMVMFPSFLSGMAFAIAPALSIVLLLAVMDLDQKKP